VSATLGFEGAAVALASAILLGWIGGVGMARVRVW